MCDLFRLTDLGLYIWSKNVVGRQNVILVDWTILKEIFTDNAIVLWILHAKVAFE